MEVDGRLFAGDEGDTHVVGGVIDRHEIERPAAFIVTLALDAHLFVVSRGLVERLPLAFLPPGIGDLARAHGSLAATRFARAFFILGQGQYGLVSFEPHEGTLVVLRQSRADGKAALRNAL